MDDIPPLFLYPGCLDDIDDDEKVRNPKKRLPLKKKTPLLKA